MKKRGRESGSNAWWEFDATNEETTRIATTETDTSAAAVKRNREQAPDGFSMLMLGSQSMDWRMQSDKGLLRTSSMEEASPSASCFVGFQYSQRLTKSNPTIMTFFGDPKISFNGDAIEPRPQTEQRGFSRVIDQNKRLESFCQIGIWNPKHHRTTCVEACRVCTRLACVQCLVTCEDCAQTQCLNCTTVRYDLEFERRLCFECNIFKES